MAMTSLNVITWMIVIRRTIHMWPIAKARKKPPIMASVQIVRVMKVCFFFS